MKIMPEQKVEIWGGMECTINRVENDYFDQLDFCGHHQRDADIELFAGLGLKKIRYPILWEHLKPNANGQIDWNKTESKLLELKKYNIDVIAGLVHHGSGPKYANISSDSFVDGLAKYAGEVATKFPWINYYTPVNEPLTTARFCGLYGLWYPHEKNDACFCRILVNECKATVMAMTAIRQINPSAKLVQTDDLGKIHSTSALSYQADFENERRWLGYDLICGTVTTEHPLWSYLVTNGIKEAELNYFITHPCPPDIIGVNHYLTSERYLDERKDLYPPHTYGSNGKHTYADVEAVRVGSVCPTGLRSLLIEAWQRYHIPIAVTEVHLHCTRDEQMRWLDQVWNIANSLCNENIPIIAITPWALLGSFGWDKLLTEGCTTYEPGVFDCSGGYPRPTILAAMIRAYSNNDKFCHPVLEVAGWWERTCRAAYGEDIFFKQANFTGKQLVISGTHATALAKICDSRKLNYITESSGFPSAETDLEMIWATISVNQYMEFHAAGKIDLVISLSGCELNQALNTGLDLFIDGESGYWTFNANGNFNKQIPDISPKQKFLAS